jgi:magnesium transporter
MKRPRNFFRRSIPKLPLIKNLKGQIAKIGEPPGTLIYTGESAHATKISLIQYDSSSSTIDEKEDIDFLLSNISKKKVNWLKIVGLSKVDWIEKIGIHFNIHPLTLEDILNVEQQPKFEEHDNYVFLTFKILEYSESTENIEHIHFAIIRTGDTLISFQERSHPIFDLLIERILKQKGAIRSRPVSYLTYRLVDISVDYYYHIINQFSTRIAELETALLESPKKEQIHEILHYKKQLLVLKKSIDPWKDTQRTILNLDSQSWPENERVYINDVFDHLNQIIAHLSAFNENLRSLTDLYMSIVSNKMNEVMKTLTIVATIFIPLTFLAGIYGMNFSNMPELEWPNGYFYTLGIMGVTGIIMFIYMKLKHWF